MVVAELGQRSVERNVRGYSELLQTFNSFATVFGGTTKMTARANKIFQCLFVPKEWKYYWADVIYSITYKLITINNY